MSDVYLPNIELKDFLEIYDSMNIGSIVADAEGTVLWGNCSYSSIAQFDIREYFGRNIREIARNENILLPRDERLIDIVIKTKRMHKEIVKYNTEDYVITTAIPVFSKSKVIKYILYTITNYSDVIRMEQELAYSNSKATALEAQLLQQQLKQLLGLDIIAETKEMQRILQMLLRVAPLPTSVMILGESGVGKDVLAQFTHGNSIKRNGSFIHVNLGAIPESLFESQLFGYEPGAFTGASKNGKIGLIELAHEGTLFLDEVGELPLDMQVKLLQVVQDKQVRRIGSSKPVPVDIRIISATNRNLRQMVEEGTFRLDLFYRLNVIEVSVPPLRERVEDITLMAIHFLNEFNSEYGTSKALSPELINVLKQYSWPGNVRELRHVIESLVVTTSGDVIAADLLPIEILKSYTEKRQNISFDKMGTGLKRAVAELEIEMIQAALREHKTAASAAKHLGIDGSTLAKKRKKYGI